MLGILLVGLAGLLVAVVVAPLVLWKLAVETLRGRAQEQLPPRPAHFSVLAPLDSREGTPSSAAA